MCTLRPNSGSVRVGKGRGGRGETVGSVVISADCPVVCAVIGGLSGHCPSAVEEMHNNSDVKCWE